MKAVDRYLPLIDSSIPKPEPACEALELSTAQQALTTNFPIHGACPSTSPPRRCRRWHKTSSHCPPSCHPPTNPCRILQAAVPTGATQGLLSFDSRTIIIWRTCIPRPWYFPLWNSPKYTSPFAVEKEPIPSHSPSNHSPSYVPPAVPTLMVAGQQEQGQEQEEQKRVEVMFAVREGW